MVDACWVLLAAIPVARGQASHAVSDQYGWLARCQFHGSDRLFDLGRVCIDGRPWRLEVERYHGHRLAAKSRKPGGPDASIAGIAVQQDGSSCPSTSCRNEIGDRIGPERLPPCEHFDGQQGLFPPCTQHLAERWARDVSITIDDAHESELGPQYDSVTEHERGDDRRSDLRTF